jgi:hypothetical protein
MTQGRRESLALGVVAQGQCATAPVSTAEHSSYLQSSTREVEAKPIRGQKNGGLPEGKPAMRVELGSSN